MKINSIWKIYCVFMTLSVVIRCRNHSLADCYCCLFFMLSSANIPNHRKLTRPGKFVLHYNSIERRSKEEYTQWSVLKCLQGHCLPVELDLNQTKSEIRCNSQYSEIHRASHPQIFQQTSCFFFRVRLIRISSLSFSLSFSDLCEVIWYAGHTHITFSANLSQ